MLSTYRLVNILAPYKFLLLLRLFETPFCKWPRGTVFAKHAKGAQFQDLVGQGQQLKHLAKGPLLEIPV
jgi:hypothetical protein